MHKLTFTERRSGDDRRRARRRSLQRTFREFWRPGADRRKHERRSFYIRRETYTVYEPDGV